LIFSAPRVFSKLLNLNVAENAEMAKCAYRGHKLGTGLQDSGLDAVEGCEPPPDALRSRVGQLGAEGGYLLRSPQREDVPNARVAARLSGEVFCSSQNSCAESAYQRQPDEVVIWTDSYRETT
jgi:hypothetical protein